MRIAILEDSPIEAELLAGWLRHANHDVHVFAHASELQRFAKRESLDLFLLDKHLPGMSGIDLLRWLRFEQEVSTPVIMMSAAGEEHDVIEGLSLGADDYLTKPVTPRMLSARIEAIMRRCAKSEDGAPIDALPYLVDHTTRRMFLNSAEIVMTDKEFDLAVLLFRNVGKHLSRGHILEKIWGIGSQSTTRTVDTHVSRIRRKLQLGPENGYRIVSTYSYGYRLEKIAPTPGYVFPAVTPDTVAQDSPTELLPPAEAS